MLVLRAWLLTHDSDVLTEAQQATLQAALALKSHCPEARVEAVDYSADALAVARANAQQVQLGVRFAQGSWLGPVQGDFDLIVSNPPYIASTDPHLAALRHEPLQALASGADGLDDIRALIAQCMQHLLPGGWLLLEHGYDQAQAVCALLTEADFAHVQSRHDLAGMARSTSSSTAGVATDSPGGRSKFGF